MNEYPITSLTNLREQVEEFAKKDITPIVKVFEAETMDFFKRRLFQEYRFTEYVCNCEEYLKS